MPLEKCCPSKDILFQRQWIRLSLLSAADPCIAIRTMCWTGSLIINVPLRSGAILPYEETANSNCSKQNAITGSTSPQQRDKPRGLFFKQPPSHLRQECIIRHPVILTDWTQFRERKTSKVKLCLIKVSGCVPVREQHGFCVSAPSYKKNDDSLSRDRKVWTK